jgi:hypothetical protein
MLDNKNHDRFYSRIEVACCLKISLPEFKREQSLLSWEYDVYAREFNSFESTIDCIYEIEKAWNTSEVSESKTNIFSNKRCASALIFNQWKDTLDIEMYLNKWRLSSISQHTYEWRDNIIKNKNLGKSSQCLVAYIHCFDEVDEDEFISKERVIQLMSKWLETGDESADFDGVQCLAYMREIWGEEIDM